MTRRRLRIVHCFRSPVGGVFRHVRDLAAAQSAAGHLVGIVCDSSAGGDLQDRLFEDMKPTLALGVWRTPMQRQVGPADLTAAWRTYSIISKLRPDILHGHGAKGGVFARLFGSLMRASRSRVARVYSPHGGSLHYDEKSAAGRVFFAAEAAMARFTDHLLFVSDYERQTFERKIGRPPKAFSLVYNGLQPSEFEPVPARESAADFLFIGQMRDLKGPDLFIDALAQAEIKLGVPVTAVMAGDGEGLPRYRAQAAALGLETRISFIPSLPARQAFSLARTVVVPSRAEAMPYIVLEALAAGKPMIATAVGGIPEIFGASNAALVHPIADELAAKMAQTLLHPAEHLAAMPSVSGLKRRFGADVMAAAIEQAYFAALGMASAPHDRGVAPPA